MSDGNTETPKIPVFQGDTGPQARSFGPGARKPAPTQVPEMEEPEATEESFKPGTPTVTEGGGGSFEPSTGKPFGTPPSAGPGSMFQVKGTMYPTLPPEYQLKQAMHEKRIQDAYVLKVLSDMRASGATEEQMRAWVKINEQSTESAQALHEQHFVPARQKILRLQQQVDDARALKVNPYSWHESIGRGGRVAAAFAALTGGFAAGKMNPNSAVAMMEAAIERDIAAQSENIRLQYANIAQAQALGQDERALFAEQLNSINEIKAMNYASIVGRIQAAQQQAVTEAHSLALQTAGDHFQMKLLEAMAAAQKELIRIEMDGPINVAQVDLVKRQIAAIQSQLGAGPTGAAVQLPTEQVALPDGTVAPQPAMATLTAAPAPTAPPGRAAAVAARGARRMGGGAPVVGRPEEPSQAPQEAPTAIEPQMIEDEAAGISRMETPEEARRRVGVEAERAKAKQRAMGAPKTAKDVGRKAAYTPVTDQEVSRAIQADPELQVRKDVADAGGFARWLLVVEQGRPANIAPTLSQAINAVMSGQPIPRGGVGLNEDANALKEMIPPPNPALYKDGKASAEYRAAKAAYDYGQEWEEIYEMPSLVDGKRNGVSVNGMRFILKDINRLNVEGGKESAYARIQDEVDKTSQVVDGLFKLADTVKKKGFDGFFTDEGWEIPGITTTDPAGFVVDNAIITQAMGYIKTQDPTARISDQDVRLGLKAVAQFMGKTHSIVDALQSLNGSADNTVRRQVDKFLGALAVECQRIMMTKTSNAFVPDYQTLQAWGERAKKIEDWVYTAPNL